MRAVCWSGGVACVRVIIVMVRVAKGEVGGVVGRRVLVVRSSAMVSCATLCFV